MNFFSKIVVFIFIISIENVMASGDVEPLGQHKKGRLVAQPHGKLVPPKKKKVSMCSSVMSWFTVRNMLFVGGAAAAYWYASSSGASPSVPVSAPSIAGLVPCGLPPVSGVAAVQIDALALQKLLGDCRTFSASQVDPLFNAANYEVHLVRPNRTQVLQCFQTSSECEAKGNAQVPSRTLKLDNSVQVVQEGYFAQNSGTKTLATGNLSFCVAVGLVDPASSDIVLAHINAEIIKAQDLFSAGKSKDDPFGSLKEVLAKRKYTQAILVSGDEANLAYVKVLVDSWGIKRKQVVVNMGWAINPKIANQGTLAIDPKGDFFQLSNTQEIRAQVKTLPSDLKNKASPLRQH